MRVLKTLGTFPGVFLFAGFFPVFSQEKTEPGKEKPKTTEEVRVTARSSKKMTEQGAGAVTIIPLDENPGRYQTLDQVLERESGLRVQRYGGLGSYSTLSIRGSTANQVNVYIDGIPLNNALTGEVNLADLNMDGAGRLEVYRSGAPSEFSGSGIGGALNLSTSGKDKTSKGEKAAVSGGSYGTARAQGRVWRENWTAAAQVEQSDQDFRFQSDNGTPVVNTIDDYDTRRKNAWFRSASATGTGTFQIGRTEFHLLDDWRYRTFGVPGPASNQTEKTERKVWRNTTGVRSDTKGFLLDEVRLGTRIYYTENRDAYMDPLQELASGNPNSRMRIQQYGLHLMPSLVFPDSGQTIRFFFGSEREDLHQETRNRTDDLVDRVPAKFRKHQSAHVEDQIVLFKDTLTITPSLRYEHYIDTFYTEPLSTANAISERSRVRREFTNAGVNASWIFFEGNQLTAGVRANGSTEKRMPNFLELFGEQGTIIGNADLRPERSESVESGPEIHYETARYEIGAGIAAFDRRITDMILFVPNSQFSLRPENVDAARITGAELSLKVSAFRHFKGNLNYTYQRAVNKSNVSYLNGKYLPLRPLHQAHALAAFFGEYWEAGLEADYTGAVFKDRTNEYFNYQESRWIYNVYVTWFILGARKPDESDWTAGLEIKNILDRRVSDVVGYPLPGRTIYASLARKF